MAFLAVTSLMRTLELQFLHPQPRVILSNKEQIKSLHEKLGDLLAFLEKFEKSADNISNMRKLTEKIINVIVKADDDIEADLTSGAEADLTSGTEADLMSGTEAVLTSGTEANLTSGTELALSTFLSWLCPCWDLLKVHHHHHPELDKTLQRVVEEVEELRQMTMKISHLVNSNITVGGSSSLRTSHVVHEEDAMVGHSEELDEVMNQLLRNPNKQLQVMAIVGMGGIGKTTFAKRIYEDPRVKSHFHLFAWTTMSLEHNKGQAIQELCRCVKPSSSAFNNNKMDWEEQLRKSLLGHRYLIIVDDIWTTDAWDDIHRCFPNDNNGSKILLTTRAREIAQYAGCGEYSYSMRFLNQDEGWDLFYNKFSNKELFQKDEFKTIGMNIVRKCQGLPLTVVVIAGFLSNDVKESIYEWENVEKKLNSLVALDLHEQFSRILTLSYNNLPSHLKGCFLYLGVFHEDSEIPVKKLIRLWIAEGFVGTIMSRHRKRLAEEVGGDYLQDLIDRSLVMVHERSFDGEIKTCRMHDLLHELCTSMAKSENVLYLETTGSRHSFERFVRLSDQRWLSLKVVNPDFHISISSEKCRSILCFNGCGSEWYLQATSFKKLRVLDLSKIGFKSDMPEDITDLVFLRYLALASTMLLNHIPLCKNWNLQTLIITEDDNQAHELPHGIWDLKQLRHLEIYHKVSIDLLRVNTVQENLQTLYWLSTSQCTTEVFLRIPNVKELGIVAGREVWPQGLNNLCCLNYLEKLRVQGSDHPLHLPPHREIFPQNLKELTFVSTLIPWEAMSVISKLPKLEVLRLKKFGFTGQEWELTEKYGFPQLKVLIISVTDLKEWKSDNVDCPFPKLQRLLLKKCFRLKEMPDWIADINTLQLIKLVDCYASLVTSANRIKENNEHYGIYIPDVVDSNTHLGLSLNNQAMLR